MRWDEANADRLAKQNRAWKASNANQARSRYHGLTRGELAARLAAQGGQCAVCKKPDLKGQDVHGDHDHQTGAFRGVLCRRCNTGIGMLGDTQTGCEAAAAYLKRHQQLQELM